MACVKLEVNCVKVICDDTDVLVLLTVYVFRQSRKLKKLMEAFGTNRSLIDINELPKNMLKYSHHSLMLVHFLVAILCQSYMILESRQS